MENIMDNIVELVDENQEVVSFEYLMCLEYNGKEYIVLSPIEQDIEDSEAEIVILLVDQDEEGNDYYTAIEDQEELDEVFDAVSQVYDQTLN